MASPKRSPSLDTLSPGERESYYLPGEVAAMFGVTTRTIANWCDRGILQAITTPTGQRRILASSLKGGRSYDAKKAAFAERMARKQTGVPAPTGEEITEAVRRGRESGTSPEPESAGAVHAKARTRPQRQ